MYHYILRLFLGLALVFTASCGGGGGGGSSGGGSDDSGEASVESLASTPTLDLSQYDGSTSSSSASVSSRYLRYVEDSGGEGYREVGNPSRAGCEANMHKKEIIRHSQQAALERCYPEAMEEGGMITIPADAFALFSITPPDMDEEGMQGFCDDIPADHLEEKERCESGEDEGVGESIKLRIGRFSGSELRVDVCFGDPGAEILESEGTYTADGDRYTATVINAHEWSGEIERSKLDLTVDGISTVTDGIVELAADGTVTAVGDMDGSFGSGRMVFEASRAGDATVNKLTGAFNGTFDDFNSGVQVEFSGRVHTVFGGLSNVGSAQFSFTGGMPAMEVEDMLPYNLADSEKADFLTSLGASLGITLKVDTLLCPNPDFDPEDPDADSTVQPMILANADGSCPELTHTGTESFSITNAESEGHFGTSVTQIFTTIADADSEFFDAVSAFDLGGLSETITTPAFVRAWDCTGDFTEIDFEAMTEAQMMAADTAMQKCFALEEKLHDNGGMSDYNCGEQENEGYVNDHAEEGGTGLGLHGGTYERNTAVGNCATSYPDPDKLYVDAEGTPTAAQGSTTYCLNNDGDCQTFKVTNNAANGLSLTVPETSTKITAMNFTQAGNAPATAVVLSLTHATAGSCVAGYTIYQPVFDAPPSGDGGGDQAGEAGYMPQACEEHGLTDPDACEALCSQAGIDCHE